MEVICGETRLSLHLSVVKYPGQSVRELLVPSVLHLFLFPHAVLSSRHTLICCQAFLQDIVRFLSLLGGSNSGSPCCLLKPVPLLCHRSSQAARGIEWQSTLRLPFPQLLWPDLQ